MNISGVIMKAENDNTGLPETCSVCGKPFEDGEGRFRRPDWVCCLDCYKERDSIGSVGKQVSAVIQGD